MSLQRPKCLKCSGAGTAKTLSFRNPKKSVSVSCDACRGKGTSKVTVDIYEIIDWLVSTGEASDLKIAQEIEERWGIPNG